MSIPALDVSHVSLSYRGGVVLEDVSLKLDEFSFLGLIGPNGAGKTIFLKTILGLIQPDAGEIRVFGKSPQRARGLVGYVPQYARFDAQFPISVRDAVLMGRLARGRTLAGYTPRDYEVVDELMALLNLMELQKKLVGKLSGGQLQRVLIARALALEPRMLLLDEPTASLDSRVGLSVYELLEKFSKSMTIILVSHDIGVISRYVRTVACLNRRLHYHDSKELTSEMLEEVYGCPVDLLAHGHAHRVLHSHHHHEE